MVIVIPSQPTIGKVVLILNDVFKFSRVVGTFPINSEYSGICKVNLIKCFFLYLSLTVSAVISFYGIIFEVRTMLAVKLWRIIYCVSSVIFYWIHLAWLIKNRMLLYELYEELKNIEYHLWRNGVFWSYKPSWCSKYLCFSIICLSDTFSFIIYNKYRTFLDISGSMLMYYALIIIMSQYTTLIEVLLSVLRVIRQVEESKTVVKLDDKLLALCQKVNTLYEPQLFVYIVVIFVLNLFFAYVTILRKEYFLPLPTFWLMSFIFPLFQMIIIVGNFSHEVKITNKMLYRRLLKNLEDETLQFHLLAKRDLVFTAAGFFILENTLICTMVTTGIDYLIFFLQYM
ncbi:Gustatory receptor 114a [Halyomorpha halys]|nr:Gustatory receptor 114a [Halyomorpha halys]